MVNALALGRRGPGSRVPAMSLFYWVATVGKLFTQVVCLPPRSSQLQEPPSTSLFSLSSWFTSSCAYHLITVTTFALTIYHPQSFIPYLKLISFTNPFLHSHSYSFRTAFTDLYWIKGALAFFYIFCLRVLDSQWAHRRCKFVESTSRRDVDFGLQTSLEWKLINVEMATFLPRRHFDVSTTSPNRRWINVTMRRRFWVAN